MRADFTLCGCRVGLAVRRRRLFETDWHTFMLVPPCHHVGPVLSVVGHGTPTWILEQFGYTPSLQDYRHALGIPWMNRHELSQAIPPAYTEWIGAQLIEFIREKNSAISRENLEFQNVPTVCA
jgi:DNA (cytosine-5)-methyltransferase 1